MANPVITSVTPAGPITVPVGQAKQITVVGQDADARSQSLMLKLVDSEGHESAVSIVDFVFTDDLTLVAAWADGSTTGLTVSGMTCTVVG